MLVEIAIGDAYSEGDHEGGKVYRDSAGNILQDGDTVIVINCKIDGVGAMSLKSEFVKKA